MNSRDRTFLALQNQRADRMPVDFWASGAMIQKLELDLGVSYDVFLEDHDVDLRYIEGPRYIGPSLDDDEDIWGVRRTVVKLDHTGQSEAYSEVVKPPLGEVQTVSEVETYAHWPSPDWFDYSVIERQCDEILEKDRVVVFMGDRLNRVAQLKPAMYLRGAENIFMDVALNTDMAEAIFQRIRWFYMEYLGRILRAAKDKIDIVLTGDDFGAQGGMLLSPDMWRSVLMKGFKEYNMLIKESGATTMHHTCGAVRDIIPDMIRCELDVLQSIQPEAAGMSIRGLKKDFGDRLCFHGGVSIQKTMPFGTPEDVRRDVKAIADAVKPAGGYIFCTAHNIQADTSVENVLSLLDAYREFGRY